MHNRTINEDFIINNNDQIHFKRTLLKKQILKILYEAGPKAIAELKVLCNNSIPTITGIIEELLAEQWVIKTGRGETKNGRRPTIYGLNPIKGYFICIILSRKSSKIIIFNLLNESISPLIELKEGIDTSENILEMVKETVFNLQYSCNITNHTILGYGVTIPGLINRHEGVSYSYSLFDNAPLINIFSNLFNKTTVIEHDTKAMAIGELWFGLAKNKLDTLFVNVDTGIGLGAIINGEIHRGYTGYSGEFGHIQLDPDGELCYCGRVGCLETLSSGTAIIKKAKEHILNGKSTQLINIVNNNLDNIKLITIINAALDGDPFSIELIEQAGEYLARGLSILIHLYNPELIVIGGEMANAKQILSNLLFQKLTKYTIPFLKQETQILFSELNEKAGLMGLLPVIMEKTLSSLIR